MLAELMVKGAVPVEVRVTGWVLAVLTVTLPKLRLPELSVNCGLSAGVPVPPRFTVAVLPVDELLVMVSWPEAEPVVVGLNCTCSVTDWLGFRVAGKFPPTMEKPVPVMAAELMLKGAVQVEVRVSD